MTARDIAAEFAHFRECAAENDGRLRTALAGTRRALEHIASLHIPDDRRAPAWADIARRALAATAPGTGQE